MSHLRRGALLRGRRRRAVLDVRDLLVRGGEVEVLVGPGAEALAGDLAEACARIRIHEALDGDRRI